MSNRVLIQPGLFRVSFPGVEVTTAAPTQLVFTTEIGKGLLTYQTGKVNVPGGGQAQVNFPMQTGAPFCAVAGAWDGAQMYTGGFQVRYHAESNSGDDAEAPGELPGQGLYISWGATKTALYIYNHGPNSVVARYVIFLTLYSY